VRTINGRVVGNKVEHEQEAALGEAGAQLLQVALVAELWVNLVVHYGVRRTYSQRSSNKKTNRNKKRGTRTNDVGQSEIGQLLLVGGKKTRIRLVVDQAVVS